MTIYADILIVVNIYITFFMLKTCFFILRRSVSTGRLLAASLFGGFSSLAVLLPPMPAWAVMLIKCIFCGAIILIAFGFSDIRKYAVHTLVFLVINIAFGGAAIAAEQLGADFIAASINGYTYINVSFVVLTVSTAAAYFAISAFRKYTDSRTLTDIKYEVEIENNGGKVTLEALCDSGNKLTDIISGLPVIVCDYSSCRGVLPDSLRKRNTFFDYRNSEITPLDGIRIVPYATVGGNSCIPVFKPKKITVYPIGEEKNGKQINALIGVSSEGLAGNDEKAIINPKIMI